MGLLKRYDKALNNNIGLIRDPNTPIEDPNSNPQQINSFNKTSFDLENPNPLGGPINEPFQTIIGNEVKFFNTTQPYTPKNTYKDSLQSDELRRRASDPIR